jgi:hypothetical protein
MTIEVYAEGDEWCVHHEEMPRREAYDEFGKAHALALTLADEMGKSIAIRHPRNVSLRHVVA